MSRHCTKAINVAVRLGTRTPRPYSAHTGKPAELPKLVPSPVLPASDVAQRSLGGKTACAAGGRP